MSSFIVSLFVFDKLKIRSTNYLMPQCIMLIKNSSLNFLKGITSRQQSIKYLVYHSCFITLICLFQYHYLTSVKQRFIYLYGIQQQSTSNSWSRKRSCSPTMPTIMELIYFWSRALLVKISFLTSYLKCSELLKNNQKKKAKLLCVLLLFINLFE